MIPISPKLIDRIKQAEAQGCELEIQVFGMILEPGQDVYLIAERDQTPEHYDVILRVEGDHALAEDFSVIELSDCTEETADAMVACLDALFAAPCEYVGI